MRAAGMAEESIAANNGLRLRLECGIAGIS
jgi:hypothetical protein